MEARRGEPHNIYMMTQKPFSMKIKAAVFVLISAVLLSAGSPSNGYLYVDKVRVRIYTHLKVAALQVYAPVNCSPFE